MQKQKLIALLRQGYSLDEAERRLHNAVEPSLVFSGSGKFTTTRPFFYIPL